MTDRLAVTLFEGDEGLEVKGESFYQDELRRIVRKHGREVPAVLAPEPENRYDGNAVSVWVYGLKVGHLSRDDAADYQPAIVRLMKEEGQPIALMGRIVGGEHGAPSYGIWLDHDPADFGIAKKAPDYRDSGGVFTGSSAADLDWMDDMPGDRLAAIKYVRELLDRETDPVERHFMFNELEVHLYKARDAFSSALAEYEEVCV